MSTMPPGWYPYNGGPRRYWDGTQWDGDFAPGTNVVVAVGGPTSSADAGVRAAAGTRGGVATDVRAKPVAGVAVRRDALAGLDASRGAPARGRVPRDLPLEGDLPPWFRRKRFVIPGVVAGLLASVAIASSIGGGGNPEPAGAAAAVAPIAAQAAAPGAEAEDMGAAAGAPVPKAVSFSGNGIHEVGVEVEPGLYRSSGTGYWERLQDASGDIDAIIANEKTSGQAYVEIKGTDGWFSTTRMEDWVLVSGAAAGPRATTFGGDGMYLVGVDIEPGTYSSSGDGYWERLKSAVGGVDGIIANGNPEGKATVKITKTDKFFSTTGMGEWTRVK